jgi:hypothetical protein
LEFLVFLKGLLHITGNPVMILADVVGVQNPDVESRGSTAG